MGIAFGFMWGIEKNKNSGLGVALLLGFTFFMGLMLSRILQYALGFSNGGSMIALAAGGTGAIFLTLSSIAATTKRDFSGMGNFLFAGVILVLLAIVANIFFQIPALSLAISAAVVGIFSAYILYDINRIVHGGETSYVTATLAVYLDVLQRVRRPVATDHGLHWRTRLSRRRFFLQPVQAAGLAPAVFYSRSNKAIDSTCAVWGNMLTIPAACKRYPLRLVSTPASRASVAGLQDTYTRRRGASPPSALHNSSAPRAAGRSASCRTCPARPASLPYY